MNLIKKDEIKPTGVNRGLEAKGSRVLERVVGIANLNDESILRFYDNIRSQVEAERDLRHKLMTGDAVKQRTSALREEITRRRLQHAPIEWPNDQ